MSGALKQYLKNEIPCYCTPAFYERGLVAADCSAFWHTNGPENEGDEYLTDILAIVEPEIREKIAGEIETQPVPPIHLQMGAIDFAAYRDHLATIARGLPR